MKVGIINYGVGNLGSVIRALEVLHVTPILINRAEDMHTAERLILPGVGNFADCIAILEREGWANALTKEVKNGGKPLLGVCLGMQLLASCSSEGSLDSDKKFVKGLGFIPGRVESLRALGCKLRTPHVGWNDVHIRNTSNGLFKDIPNGTDFYFVHSYMFLPDEPEHIIATTNYDIEVAVAVKSGHVWGTQFHPEKSSRAGFKLLSNFIENSAC